jgi:hypothetical protein
MTKKKKEFSPISKHKQQGGVLRTKASELNFNMIDWERDLMPEHIWIDLLAEEYKKLNWFKIYEDFLDKLDSCLEIQPKTPLLGFISDFSVPSEKERTKFISEHREFIYNSFFKPVGKILFFYPENPANWLILEEWKNIEKINFEVELNKLASSLARLIKAKDLYAGHIRAIPLNRMFKHRKILFPSKGMEELINLLPKYPGRCNEKEKYRVQQFARIQMNLNFTTADRFKENKWAKYFWQQNHNLVPCSPISGSLDKGDNLDTEQMKELQAKLWDNCVVLMKYLDKVAMQYKYNLYDPTIDEIKLGLFSRIMRLYISFVSNPFFWNRDLSGILLRCLGETTIIFFYLISKGSLEDFVRFKEYAQGKEKLLMLHLQDNLDSPITIDGKTIDDIAQSMGGGFTAEIMNIDLNGWTKKTIWQMAREVKLENIYRWVIDPSSAELHGSWTSIRKSNLVVCSQILHRYHMVPQFYEPPIYLMSLFIAEQIYLRCQQFAIEQLGFPKPSEELKEIPGIKEICEKRIKAARITEE